MSAPGDLLGTIRSAQVVNVLQERGDMKYSIVVVYIEINIHCKRRSITY